MPLTSEQKAQNARERMIEVAKHFQLGTYSNKFVSSVFQQMIRAEAAALPEGLATVIIKGELGQSLRVVGQCACVTCGKILRWKANSAWMVGVLHMHTGHFLASRCNSILYEEDNCAPQCSRCNYYRSGEQQLFRKWMLAVRPEAVERLERLKTKSKQFDRETLVDMRISYKARLDAAVERMTHGTS